MKRVYKYEKRIDDFVVFNLPVGAVILHIDIQKITYDAPVCLWALVDPNVIATEKRTIRIAGTGHPIEDFGVENKYINTFTVGSAKELWFHAFEVKEHENG